MLTTMNEAKAKELKNCGKDSLDKIKKIMAQGGPSRNTGQSILDRICQFVSGNESGSFAIEGQDIFLNETAFASAIKKCDPSVMER